YRFIATVDGNSYPGVVLMQQAPAAATQGGHAAPEQAVPAAPELNAPSAPVTLTTRRRWLFALWSAAAMGVAAVVLLLVVIPPGVVGNIRRRVFREPDAPAIHSIAVLPLQNLSPDPSQEYFADGMTEELITELSGIRALKVISRTSVMRYKKSDKSLPEIARELHVDGIVEGSVVRDGNKVRVTAQMIYAPTDKNIWARSFERQFQDSLTLQSEVAFAIAGAVRAQVAADERARLQTARPVDPKAIEAYLRGNYHLDRYGSGSGIGEAQEALEYFRQAIAEDPGFAAAYLKMADAYSAHILPYGQTAPLIKAAAEKALALDPTLARAHAILGDTKWGYDRDWQGAEREYKRAFELDPNDALAHDYFGRCLILMGRKEEGLNQQQRAQELDPLGEHMGDGLYQTRQYDRAIDLLTKYFETGRPRASTHFILSESYAQKGMYEEAIQHLRTAATLFGFKEIAESLNRAYAAGGYKAAMGQLAKDTEQLYTEKQISPGWIGRFYIRAGDQDRALKWLRRDYEERGDDQVLTLMVDPVWDPLRSDARFKDLVRRVGLPQVVVSTD
ncbi:MAG TPA: tetratricopeptide repeat protein, partial [Terriglobales bacterium]